MLVVFKMSSFNTFFCHTEHLQLYLLFLGTIKILPFQQCMLGNAEVKNWEKGILKLQSGSCHWFAQPGAQQFTLLYLVLCSIKTNTHLSNSKYFTRSPSYHVYIHCYRNTCNNMRCSLQIRMLYLSKLTKEIVRHHYLELPCVCGDSLCPCLNLSSFPIQQQRQKTAVFSQ